MRRIIVQDGVKFRACPLEEYLFADKKYSPTTYIHDIVTSRLNLRYRVSEREAKAITEGER